MFILRNQKPVRVRNRFAGDHAPSYRSDRREARLDKLAAKARVDRKVVAEAIEEALGDHDEDQGFDCPVGGGMVQAPGFTLKYHSNGRLLSAHVG